MLSWISRIGCLAGLAPVVVVGPATTAAPLLAGGTDGAVYKGDSHTGGFDYFGCVCLVTVQALAFDDAHVYAGDWTGVVERLDRTTGDLLNIFWVPDSDVTDIVFHDGDLLVSAGSGSVARVDPITGEVISTLTAPISIQAMALDGDDLYVAGTIGEVYKGSAINGGFQQFGKACLAPVQALTLDENRVYAGDLTGAVLGFELSDGSNTVFFFAPNAITGMVMDGNDLLVSDLSGAVHRYNPVTATLIQTINSQLPIDALEILPLLGDLTGDGTVDVEDLFALFAAWGRCIGCPEDLDGNGTVGITDIFILFANWS